MLYASDVKIPADLSSAMGKIGTNAYGTIGSNYATAKKQMLNDASVRGIPAAAASSPSNYGIQRLGTTQGLDVGNLESALGGQLGSTSYQNQLAERDYNQQRQLAEEAAALNKPSLLQQIMMGIGSVGRPVAIYAGMGGFRGSPSVDPLANVYGNI